MQFETNGHKFGLGSLHTRLKGFSKPSLRTANNSDTTVDRNIIDSPLCPLKKILDLPVELILSICDHLPIDSQACLALACHQLCYFIGTRVFKSLDTTRFELASFLQKLQKDRPDRDLWLCYGCLRFHSTTHRYEPPNFRALSRKEMPGFPYCQSTYAKAIEEVFSELDAPWTEGSKQMHWMEDDITSPVHMRAYISSLGNPTNLMLRIRYRINCFWKHSELTTEDRGGRLLQTFGLSNLGICPHMVFARDWQRGDGSVMSVLQEREEEYHAVQDSWHVFECKECQLDVEVKMRRMDMEVVATVWQYVGKLPPPARNSKEACLEPCSLPLSTRLPSSRAKRFSLLKALSSRLDRLKKRESAPAALQAEVAPLPLSTPVVLLPGQGAMQRRWESLEIEAQESSVGVKYTALTVLEDGENESDDGTEDPFY